MPDVSPSEVSRELDVPVRLTCPDGALPRYALAGDARERAGGYLAAWSEQKAVDGTTGSLAAVLGTAGLRALRRRLGRRLARSVGAAAPFLVGAALSGRGNRRATETLAERVRTDLRRGRTPAGGRD